MLILGIETSCDETAAALVEYKQRSFFIHSNIVSSQVKIHSKYGGIVPEVAARNHVKNIIPVIDEGLKAVSCKAVKPIESHKAIKPYSHKANRAGELIDAIAVTNGPGLITSLMVGVETAKGLAYAWNKPLIAVNHLEAHIYSAIKHENTKTRKHFFNFPALALIVSGGHTQLVLMSDHGKYKIIGETRDDAAGEAFDKVAKLLGLGYPGGPAIAAGAAKFSIFNFQFSNNNQFPISNYKIGLPRPMIDSGDFDFSFSGLKTAALYSLKALKLHSYQTKNKKSFMALQLYGFTAKMCAEFQQAVIDVLITKTIRAAKKHKVKTVILSGGVSANKELRKQMAEAMKREIPSSVFCLPSPGLSTDNAAMVAMAGAFHYQKKGFTSLEKIKVEPNLEITN